MNDPHMRFLRTIKPPRYGSVAWLVHNMRPEDKAEAEAFAGSRSTEGHIDDLWAACRDSDVAYVAHLPGTNIPVAVYGVESTPEFPGVGFVWMHGTKDLGGVAKWDFLRLGRYGLQELKQRYHLLVCFADSRNTLHTRWLRWMGFIPLALHYFHDPDVPFLEFVLPGEAKEASA